MEEQLVDIPVSQQASPSGVELPIPVEISSSSGTPSPSAEGMNSPEMGSQSSQNHRVLQGHNHLLVMQNHQPQLR
jgi:hypothetical protein